MPVCIAMFFYLLIDYFLLAFYSFLVHVLMFYAVVFL